MSEGVGGCFSQQALPTTGARVEAITYEGSVPPPGMEGLAAAGAGPGATGPESPSGASTSESRKLAVAAEDGSALLEGEIYSTQSITSKTRTVETVTVSQPLFQACVLQFSLGRFFFFFQGEISISIVKFFVFLLP